MSSPVEDQVVLVTGASRGIGRAVALAFAREGAHLVIAARSPERLAEVAEEARTLGAAVLSVQADVTSEPDVDALVAAAIEKFGRIDILVNNAGIARFGATGSAKFASDVRETLEASLFGMISVTRLVLPLLRRQGHGTIVNLSSVMGFKAIPQFGSYGIVMHAVSAYSDSLRQELAGTGISVSVIYPAVTATDLFAGAALAEVPRAFRHITPMRPDKVARAVVSAVRRGKRRVVLPRVVRLLLVANAVSSRLGDLMVRAIGTRTFLKLMGLNSGATLPELLASNPKAAEVSAEHGARPR